MCGPKSTILKMNNPTFPPWILFLWFHCVWKNHLTQYFSTFAANKLPWSRNHESRWSRWRLPWNVIICQRLSSIKGCPPSKIIFDKMVFFLLHPYACVMLRTFFPSRHSLFLVNAADCISVHAIPGSDRPSKIVPLTLSRTGGVNLTRPITA